MGVEAGQELLHYRLIERIGAGGMGVVWRALDTTLGREVALKVLPDEVADDPARLARFEREARALAALDHPNIVAIHSIEQQDGVRFITMDLVRGRPLADAIPQDGLPVTDAMRVALDLAGALAAAHERGVVHRDLKPQNVMLGDDGRVRVLDFGLVKLTRAGDAGGSSGGATATATATAVGHVVGTVPYMSPEQLKGETVDARTDVFALGVMLYEMATGRHPFAARSNAELVAAILTATPPPPSRVRAGLPAALDAVVARCLAKDASARYGSARELARDLERVRDGLAVGDATATASRGVSLDTALREAIEAGGESSTAVLEMLRDSEQRKARRDAGWIVVGGVITAVTGVALFPFLYSVAPGEPVWFVGFVPLLAGVAMIVWGRIQLRAVR